MRCSRCRGTKGLTDGAICDDCKDYMRRWRSANRHVVIRHQKSYYKRNCIKLTQKKVAWQKTEHGKRIRAALNRKWRTALRAEMIVAYGGGCTCCGETIPEFLALEHLNGNGREDRRKSGGTLAILGRLKKSGWPKDSYTVLCHNCNMAKGFYGECPHVKKRLKVA